MTDKQPLVGQSLFTVSGIVIIMVIVILVNVLMAHVNLRWDATENKLYSLTEGTHKILADLQYPVTLKLFYSQDAVNMPVGIKTYANRLQDVLAEYQHLSQGRLTVEIINPKPDSEEEEAAQNYGIQALSLPMEEGIYFGLVALAADQEESIAYLDPTREKHLEYDITRLIARVQTPQKRVIGIVSGLPVFGQRPMGMPGQGGGQPAWLFVQELRKTYDVKQIAPTAESLDEGLDLLMLVFPKNLSPALSYAIDQYVLKGGKLIVFADPLALLDRAQGGPQPGIPDTLFNAWGIKMEPTKILADFGYATRVATQNNQVENSPIWISPQADAFNSEEIITGELESMLMPMAGIIEKTSDDTAGYTALITSSPDSALVEAMMARFGGEALRRDFKATDQRYDLAVMLRGVYNTAFADGPPPAEAAPTTDNESQAPAAEQNHLAKGTKPATIIVVADADMLFDRFYVNNQNFLGMNISQIFNDNLNFVLNATEMLAGDEALIGIRSRGAFERPFTRVQALEQKAQLRWLAREQELVSQVEATNAKLRTLEENKDSSQKLILSAEQEAEIEKFRAERQRINRELKQVRRNLRADIDSLGNRLKFINIVLMPLLVSLAGIAYAFYLRRKRR